MNAITVGPARYRAWRASLLGGITERLEQALLLELAMPVARMDVLDLGCGDGSLLALLLNRGAKASGIDADPDMIAAARTSLPKADIQEGDACRLPFADASFDLIIANTLLCLVPQHLAVLAEAGRVLRPGGRLVIGELNRWSLWALIRRIKAWCGSKLWARARFNSGAALSSELALAGFQAEQVRGAIFYPPLGIAALLLAPLDPWLGRRTVFGAAFIAIAARKR